MFSSDHAAKWDFEYFESRKQADVDLYHSINGNARVARGSTLQTVVGLLSLYF